MTEPAHYKRGPSGGHRWLICTDSPEAEAPFPDETSDAADEGTAAHWLLEQCLKSGNDAQVFADNLLASGQTPTAFVPAGEETGCEQAWPITGEMVESVQLAIDEVNKQAKKRGTKLFVEERVFIGPQYGLNDTVGGTADIIMWLPKSKTLYVLDFKYGRGHVVEVAHPKWGINPQIGLYVIAALCELERLLGKKVDVKWVVAGIIQPRAYHKKGSVRTKKITPFQLMDLELDLVAAVNGERVRAAGDHCHFCRAKSGCDEYHRHRGEAAVGRFEAEAPPEEALVPVADRVPEATHDAAAAFATTLPGLLSRPVKGLNLNDLARARQTLSFIKAWAREVEDEVRARLLNDLKVPGARLAAGRGKRDYGGSPAELSQAVTDTAAALGVHPSFLHEPSKLKSPSALEKELGKAKFKGTPLAAMVTHQEGGPVVVDEDSDKPDYVKDNGFEAEAPVAESPLL
jgi:hypothetical protein